MHRYTLKQFSQTSLSWVEPTKEEVMALWGMRQRHMDKTQPWPGSHQLPTFTMLAQGSWAGSA
ncbi:hypothetical protein, partial [Marinobacter sp.]|uniref:hypothetical protein n=1 Tax=Marinobacter sp. TaxID=50741 RepID=UPI003566C6D6